jgi:DNA-binding transcriptional LysR family regulator
VDPRRLLVLLEVARAGSLAGAARTLGWTQPAVSQHVRRLERDTGTSLVVREGRGVRLTEAGAVLARHAEAVAARLSAAREEVAALADLRAGRVRLAAFPSALATLVPAALACLAVEHGGVDVRLTEVEPPEARELLLAGQCDLAVVFGYDDVPDDAADLSRSPLLIEPVRAVLPQGHRLAGRRALGLADLAGERWVAGCERCRAHLLGAAAAAGVAPDVRHEIDDYVVTQELVAAGLGVAALPRLALEASRRPGVAVVPLRDVGDRAVEAVTRPGDDAVPAIGAVLQALRRAAAARAS